MAGMAKALGCNSADTRNSYLCMACSNHKESFGCRNRSLVADTGIETSDKMDIDTGFANCRDLGKSEGNTIRERRILAQDKDTGPDSRLHLRTRL